MPQLKVTKQCIQTTTYYVETGTKSMLDFGADGDLATAERLDEEVSHGPESMTVEVIHADGVA